VTPRERAHDACARLDRLEAGMSALRAEERRLARLGLAPALAECRRRLRHFEFERAMLRIAAAGPLDRETPDRGAW